MHIVSIDKMPINFKSPTQPASEKVAASEDKEVKAGDSEDTKKSGSDTVHISMEGMKKLDEESKSDTEHLPQHIKQMIEAIENIIKMIEQAEEVLAKAKEENYPDEETKRQVIEGHQNQVSSLQQAKNDAITNLIDAMKEAGISEPGIISDLMG